MTIKHRSKIVMCVTLFLIAVRVSPSQIPETKRTMIAQVVDHAAEQFFKRAPQGVGLSIGVFKEGKTYEFNYRTSTKGSSNLPTAHTIYRIASITKTFTGTLLAQAAVEKRVRLDDDIRKYLDGDYPNLEFQGHPIKLFQLVNHRSGLPFFLPDKPETRPDYTGDLVPWGTRIAKLLTNYSREDFFADLHRVTLTAVPNTEFKYSNAAAQLLGYILERIFGMPYEELVKRKIARPLQMNDTTIALTASQRARLAKGYDEMGHVVPDNPDQIQAAGALKSTSSDLLKYVQWQIAEVDAAVKLTHEPTFTDHNYSAGLNWQILRTADNRVIWQSGNIPGFDSNCIIEPELKLGLVILANEEDRRSSRELCVMANEILRALDSRAVLLPD